MSNELVVIEKLELVPFFTKGNLVDDVLAKIKAEAMAHVPDVSTKKGRDAIKANVTKVTKSKTYLESQGKDLAAEYKLIPKAIDANRKKTKDFLNDLQIEIRQPLTDWEDEQKRIEAEELAKQQALKVQAERDSDHELATLQFEAAMRDREIEKQRLIQERLDQDEAIRVKAATDAKLKAEQEAQADIDKANRDKILAEQAVINAKAKADQEIIDAKNREDQLKQAAIKAEEFAKFQSEQAELRRTEAEKKSTQDAIDSAENARLAQVELQRLADKQLADEKAAREADVSNRTKKNNEAKGCLMELGFDERDAKKIIIAIAQGQIHNVGINY
ncbi:MAG: hypothetical protein HRU18_23485 [Pseudoalteromonas sp.]|uniref:hypothetical protein n=1 Tax=Pseudoalteromonas sp. TaxID=53249 RepID=UPI001DA772CC|nr:hypothetical protein [Pseudoalteromonas sp.]NRA81174.1 hypothetical protein [Pseudoalteromonas sp.]